MTPEQIADPLRCKSLTMAEYSDTRSTCPKCGEWRDSPTADCAGCGYEGAPMTPEQIAAHKHNADVDGEWCTTCVARGYADGRAHLDTLTEAVEVLAADCVNDHAGIPYYVINELDRIAAMSNGEPHDACR